MRANHIFRAVLAGVVGSVGMLLSLPASAAEGIVTGFYRGEVSDHASIEYSVCRTEEVTIRIDDLGEGAYSVQWREKGRELGSMTECVTVLDAKLLPRENRPGNWRVRFEGATKFSHGFARFSRGRLNITTTIPMGIVSQKFSSVWKFGDEGAHLDYSRRVERSSTLASAKGRLERE